MVKDGRDIKMNIDDIDFKNVICVEGSKNNGFEEFCCQIFHLSSSELNIPQNSNFYRVRGAGGDGGVEAYWQFPNGKEIGIQAKYFFSLDSSKWTQVKKSIEKAKKNHPNLSKYIICFPIDLTDSHEEGKTTNRDIFNEEIKKWNNKYKPKGMELEFWGLHELTAFLQRNIELMPFWFDKISISQNDFSTNFKTFKDIVGDRYQPEINIDLEKFDYFNYLQQNLKFVDILNEKLKDLEDKNNKKRYICEHIPAKYSRKIKSSFFNLLTQLEENITNLSKNLFYEIDYECLNTYTCEILETLNLIIQKPIKPIKLTNNYSTDDFRRDFNELDDILYNFKKLINSSQVLINKKRILFLNGEGGKGKTHLMASIIDERNKNNLVSLIFDGGQLDLSSTISDTIKKNFCGLSCSNDEFYTALDTLSWLSGQRGVIFIDALDEQSNCKLWQKKLPVFLREIEKYKHLAVAISYRTEYQKDIFVESLEGQKDLFCTAPGFTNIKIHKLAKIFNKYEVEIPTLPTLYPEFYNPLFLILYCKYLQNMGEKEVGNLTEGYTNIFGNYINSINKKISTELDLDESNNTIQKICKEIALKMYDEERQDLPKKDVNTIIEKYHSTNKHSQSILKKLLSDGFISKYKHYGEDEEYIRFSFGKFSDFIIINNLVDNYFDINNPLASFKKGTKLHDVIFKYMRHTPVEIMATVLPEKTNGKIEILDIYKKKKDDFINPYSQYFLESLKDRNPKYITKRSIDSLFKLFQNEEEKIIETLIFLSLKQNCIIDSKKLHSYLKNMKLFERDSFWSCSIDYLYENKVDNIIEKIISYIWECDNNIKNNKFSIDYAILLSWFLTSSNRSLRDKSTKSLTNLFTYNLDIVPKVLENFNDINDAYVLERIYCAVYGACLRNKSFTEAYNNIKSIAKKTYDLIFKDNNPPPHFLIRDYAKNIIELAISLKLIDSKKVQNIIPPYKSTFPKIPTQKNINKIYECIGQYNSCNGKPLLKNVHYSVPDGDWGIYVLKHVLWKISEKPQEELAENQLTEFIETLKDSSKIWKDKIYLHDFEIAENELKVLDNNVFDSQYATHFLNSLNKTEKNKLFKIVKIYQTEQQLKIKRLHSYNKCETNFIQDAENWILKRVADLCDYKTLPDEFKDYVPYNGRASKIKERIGKKYQWIALYEFIGYALDKFIYVESDWVNKIVKYDGALHFGNRDIDPTLTTKDFKENAKNPHPIFKNIISPNSKKSILKNWCCDKNVPDPIKLIEQSHNKNHYLNLCTYYDWYTKISHLEDDYDGKFINFYWFLKSYIINKNDLSKVIKFFKKKNFFGRWVPEESDYGDFYHGEYPSCKFFKDYVNNSLDWLTGDDFRSYKPNFKIKKLMANYFDDTSRDCSYDKPAIDFLIPSPALINEMNLLYGGKDCSYLDKNRNEIIFNPYTKYNGKNSLLIDKKAFIDFLNNNNYTVFWTIGGEKRVEHGKIDISGLYYIKDDKIEGKLNFSKFEVFPAYKTKRKKSRKK